MTTLHKIPSRALWAIALSTASIGAQCAGTQTGTVQWINMRSSDGLQYFLIDGTKTGAPSCATAGYWVIQNENTATGRAQMMALLMAQAAGKTVSVNGAGACTRWGDGEDVNSIQIQ